MSMLAGPKRKKQYVLNPRGKPLYNDDDRFGSKMLQKMGWSKGKGLGAKESGSIDFVRVNFKCDAAGLGYEDRDDQWTQHEKGFNGFLESLHADNSNENSREKSSDDDGDDNLGTVGFGFKQTEIKTQPKKLMENISGHSLEERSKKSRARVHYKKYTKGKDLAQYSEKDLANIFGKKVVDNEVVEKSSSSDENECKYFITPEKTVEIKEESVDATKESTMLKTSVTSIDDYFRNKMLQRKAAKQRNLNNGELTTEREDKLETGEKPAVEAFESKPKNRKSKRGLEELQQEQEARNAVETEQTVLAQPKKKKKKEKNSKEAVDEVSPDFEFQTENQASTESVCVEVKQKKKKHKSSIETLEDCTNKSEVVEVDVADETETKSKRRKHAVGTETSAVNSVNHTDSSETKKKQKKQKSRRETFLTLEHEKPTKKESNLNSPVEKKTQNKKLKKSEKKGSSFEENVKFSKVKMIDDAKTITNRQEFHKFYCTYQISTFVAEKFRHLDFNKFRNSNLAQLLGYSHNEHLKIEIVQNPLDEFRILDLWKRSFDKYSDRKIIREQAKHAKNSEATTKKNVEGKATKNAAETTKPTHKRKGKKGLNNLKRQKRRSIFKLGI